jgi:hypothetical protein
MMKKHLVVFFLFSNFSGFLGSQTGLQIIVLLFFKHGLRCLFVFSLNPMFVCDRKQERKEKDSRF